MVKPGHKDRVPLRRTLIFMQPNNLDQSFSPFGGCIIENNLTHAKEVGISKGKAFCFSKHSLSFSKNFS